MSRLLALTSLIFLSQVSPAQQSSTTHEFPGQRLRTRRESLRPCRQSAKTDTARIATGDDWTGDRTAGGGTRSTGSSDYSWT